MTMERIKELYNAQPFEPFVIYLADGRELLVAHKEFMSFSASGCTVVVHTPEDRMHVINQSLIATAEVKKAPRKRKRSGKHHG